MRFILTHIPRTGGTSIFAAVRGCKPDARAVEFESMAEVALMTDQELNSYNLISTYVGSKLFDRINGSWIKVLILRDPIARLRSSYWNLRNCPDYISPASRFAKQLGFRDYLASRDPAVIMQSTNVQTWTVFGDKSMHYRRMNDKTTQSKIVNEAVKNFSKYTFVGFTEHLDSLWSKICRALGNEETPLPTLRANQTFQEMDEPREEDLIFHTALDCQLVQRAYSMTVVMPH